MENKTVEMVVKDLLLADKKKKALQSEALALVLAVLSHLGLVFAVSGLGLAPCGLVNTATYNSLPSSSSLSQKGLTWPK